MPEADTSPIPDAKRSKGRKRRTPALIASAAALGVLAGTVTGYAIQYDREPTPLAPLAQQNLPDPAPKAPDERTTAKSINAHRWSRTEDDLVPLLVDAPGGATVTDKGYRPVDVFSASFYEDPGGGLDGLVGSGVRRVAALEYVVDDTVFVDVALIQFRDRAGAEAFQRHQVHLESNSRRAANRGVDIPGVPADFGRAFVYAKPLEEAGYHPLYLASAVARRGDVAVFISYHDNKKKVSQSDIVDLAKRQMERL
ncbi:hypothetical protein [Streptomyces sp. WAC06614]|uniref:hypothetical protein n=1 Tax=Streptomyces sp. WAC06614 TaxID=2487416 RepID=UPI000F7B017D|nr:hypothetical protein [Streptomyces sp. WAC06614]RSS62763.1 hypothetical protein EF918_31150 [Streptomyces sp. WAC06614]